MNRTPLPPNVPRHQRGIILAIVLVLIFALITAVYSFQRNAIIDATISRNRVDAAEADALAKGGLRIAEVVVAIVRAKQLSDSAGGTGDAQPLDTPAAGINTTDLLWQGIENFPFDVGDDRSLKIEIEDEGAKLNLNALVAPLTSDGGGDVGVAPLDDVADSDRDLEAGSSASDEAVEYLEAVIEYIIEGIDAPPEDKNHDATKIAENLLDFIDGDEVAVNGRNENDYYRGQDPPYVAWNRPLVSIDQIGMVEDVDPALVKEMRKYLTVHPIGDATGINLNRASPWVLKLVYAGNSGNRRLIDDRLATDLMRLRDKGKKVCDEEGLDPSCVSRSDVGNGDLGNGDVYPAAVLPAKPTVFRVVATAQVGSIRRRFEAIFDTRPNPGPQVLSWRRLRGVD
jgi:type II secretory pathway component PulK